MKKTYAVILLTMQLSLCAQTDCLKKLYEAQRIVKSDVLIKDYEQIFRDLLQCAKKESPKNDNLLAIIYGYGLGVPKDEVKGFYYMENAAKQNDAVAQFNLGDMYREGRGCKIDMKQAVYWYQKAANNNFDRAAYGLGYMHMKGFGVDQDYSKAISWYKKSNYFMAKHWLGVCYYLGYGVEQNTEKALEYLLSNNSPNSKAFLENLKVDKRDKVLSLAQNSVKQSSAGTNNLSEDLISSRHAIKQNKKTSNNIKIDQILGEWTGRFIEYDWSGKIPQRVLPMDISFSQNKQGELKAKVTFEGKTIDGVAMLKNNNLFVDSFKFDLEQLYSHSFKAEPLDFTVLGMDLSFKNSNNTNYLLVDVDSFLGIWKEPGMPISLVLRPKSNHAISITEDAAMLELASQKTEFIKVYPVPFEDQLYIGFDIDEVSDVQVTLTSLATANIVQVAKAKLKAGMQSYTINTADMPKGYYVIKVHDDEKTHTRIVIKE